MHFWKNLDILFKFFKSSKLTKTKGTSYTQVATFMNSWMTLRKIHLQLHLPIKVNMRNLLCSKTLPSFAMKSRPGWRCLAAGGRTSTGSWRPLRTSLLSPRRCSLEAFTFLKKRVGTMYVAVERFQYLSKFFWDLTTVVENNSPIV